MDFCQDYPTRQWSRKYLGPSPAFPYWSSLYSLSARSPEKVHGIFSIPWGRTACELFGKTFARISDESIGGAHSGKFPRLFGEKSQTLARVMFDMRT